MSGYRWNGTVPEGPLCACGCWQPVKIAKRSDARFGMVKGRPMMYVHGHNRVRGSLPHGHKAWHRGGLRADLRGVMFGNERPQGWARGVR